jgi:hypothetical protein
MGQSPTGIASGIASAVTFGNLGMFLSMPSDDNVLGNVHEHAKSYNVQNNVKSF